MGVSNPFHEKYSYCQTFSDTSPSYYTQTHGNILSAVNFFYNPDTDTMAGTPIDEYACRPTNMNKISVVNCIYFRSVQVLLEVLGIKPTVVEILQVRLQKNEFINIIWGGLPSEE